MKKHNSILKNEIVQFMVFLIIGVVLLCSYSWPTHSFDYSGIAADTDGNVYVGEKRWIGVYKNNEKVRQIIGNEGGRYYEFTIIEDQIHLWGTTNHRKVLDLNGIEIQEHYEMRHGPVFIDKEKREYMAEDGRFYELENGLLKRAKVTCYYPDGSEEIKFQMPLGLYLTKLAFFVYLSALALWIGRPIFRYMRTHW